MNRFFIFLSLLHIVLVGEAQQHPLLFRNQAYAIAADRDAFTVTDLETGAQRRLSARVELAWSSQDPALSYHQASNHLSPQAAWNTSAEKKVTDFYKAVNIKTLQPRKVRKHAPRGLAYQLAQVAEADVSLVVELPEGRETPLIRVEILARKPGWFSAGFAGIAPQDTSRLAFLYQPMIWSWRRFPDQSYVTPEQYATTAAVFTNNGRFTEGLAPEPSDIPFRFARLDNSRFGLMLRNAKGEAQPMLFAPLFGAQDSYMKPGQHFGFSSRYVLKSGNWYDGLSYILRNIFHYRNERRNNSITLNQTIDNMIGLAMHDVYGGWVDSLRGFSYEQDAVGTVKVVSALHPLGVSLVTGDEEMFRRRALPAISYMMSREKYLFSPNPEQKTQSPSYTLNGPCADIGELSGLMLMTNGKTPAFGAEMTRIFGKSRKLNLETETGGGGWQDYLYRYRVSRDSADLMKAREGADLYLRSWTPYPSTFNNDPGLRDKSAAFLTDFTPRLYDLLELYELTQDRSYLDWAVLAARQMILWTRSNPMAPDSIIRVNVGGKVKGFIGKRYKLNSYDFLPGFDDTTHISEQEVEAWQTSLAGLPPEQPGTYMYGPIMLTHHAAWFLRLAHLSGDSLLRDAAYNAVLGRYAGFPGYYFTSLHTNVYQKAGYAMHPFMNIRYNAIFHNHIFPHIALLIDFLVNDARLRSNGQVDFPGIHAPGYAYLSSKVYGQNTGSIFGNRKIRLWLPDAALQGSSTACNHLLGVGENDLYVVLMNTLSSAIAEQVRLNPDVIPWTPGKIYRVVVYYSDGSQSSAVFKDGLLNVELGAQALVAYKIESLKVDVPFPASASAEDRGSVRKQAFVRDDRAAGFSVITGMMVNVDPRYSDAYVFTNAAASHFRSVRLRYRLSQGEWLWKEDNSYPFEFDIHLQDPGALLEFQLIGVDHANESVSSSLYTLSNQ